MARLLIQNCRIVSPAGIVCGNILCDNGRIEAVGATGTVSDAAVIDAAGRYALPGAVDPHVHLSLTTASGITTADSFATGTRAALCGGTTTVIDFVTPGREELLEEALNERLAGVLDAQADVFFHISVTKWRSSIPEELKKCRERGITSCKLYLAYRSSIGVSEEVMERVMAAAAELDMTILVHCEKESMIKRRIGELVRSGDVSPYAHALSRPASAETRAVRSALFAARRTGCRVYLVHLSTAGSIEAVKAAHTAGIAVFAETCPHYLAFTSDLLRNNAEEAVKYIMSPPLRRARHGATIRHSLNGLIDTVATDHCPFNLIDKLPQAHDFRKIPNGVPGIARRLPVLWTLGVSGGLITPERFVALVAENPARIFGLYPQKGVIAPGSDADIVLWDETEWIVPEYDNQIAVDHDIYAGMHLSGRSHCVIRKGAPVFSEGILHV